MKLTVSLAALIALVCLLPDASAASDRALLILKSTQYADTQITLSELEGAGCQAQHVIPPRCIIALVPPDAEETVLSLKNVAALYRDSAPSYTIAAGVGAAAEDDINSGIKAWNYLIQPKPLAMEQTGSPLVNDNFDTSEAVPAGGYSTATASAAPGSSQIGEFLAGNVAVGVILPESTGSGENWTSSRQNDVFNKIVAAMDWWVGVSNPKGARLTFFYDKQFSISTQYEPIQYNENNKSDWLLDVFNHMGYTSGSYTSRAMAYDNDIRKRLGTNWGFCYVIADSLNDSDGKFPNGSFAWRETAVIFMTYDNDGWGFSAMDKVAAHEMGHMFGACDEYCQPGWACCDGSWYCGYLNVKNSNCELNNPNSVSCKMKDNNASGVCSWTVGQLGWTDSNANGKPDVIDRPINNTINPIQSPTSSTSIAFTGSTSISPCPSPTRSAVTINKVLTIRYWMDSGPISFATPTDGAYDSDVEDYSFTLTNVPAGTHTVYTRVYDNFGNTSSVASQTLVVQNPDSTPPIMGAVIDSGTVTYQDASLSASWSATEPDSSILEYQYAIGTSPADPGSGYTKPWTSTGTLTSVNVTGLSLAGDQSYYFYVKARNASSIWCSPAASDGVKVTLPDIGTAKALPPDTAITLKDAVVSAAFSGRFYIQDTTSCGGIAVNYGGTVARGDKVRVRGSIGRGDSSSIYERSVSATGVSIISSGNAQPEPLCLLTKVLGGARLNADTPGVVNGVGANNIGLLVRICGRVYKKYAGKFYVDDGCKVTADGTNKGVRVESAKSVNVGDMVICTGVVSTYDPGTLGGALPVIKTRDTNDVRVTP